MLMVITVASVLLAFVMSVVAWRASRAERERSDARIEALARDIHAPVDAAAGTAPPDEIRFRALDSPAPLASDMFAVSARPVPATARWGLALAVGAFLVASLAALLVVLGGDGPGTRVAIASAPEQKPAARKPAVEAPLELVSLDHERDGNQLTVRGVVRNPATGTEMDRLTAVVVLLDHDGTVLSTARAAVASPTLIPGGQSPFAITITDAGDVGRYRVSFRSGERMVSHVDKRVAP